VDPGAGDGHDRALLMATSARFQWPSPRGFVSAYAQNLMAADIPAHRRSAARRRAPAEGSGIGHFDRHCRDRRTRAARGSGRLHLARGAPV